VVASELVGSKKAAGSSTGASARKERWRAPCLRPIAAAMTLLLAQGPHLGATELYWDINGASAGLGGTGTWNTSTANWNNSSGTGTPLIWNNSAPDDAVFQGTAGTVTLGSSINFGRITFKADGYTVTGNTLNLLSTGSTVSVDPGLAATIASALAGTGALIK